MPGYFLPGDIKLPRPLRPPPIALPSPFKPPPTTLLAFVRTFAEVLPAAAPPAFNKLPAAVAPPAFDILPPLFNVLLEEVPEDVEFDEDLPLVGFDASPLGGVAAVIFD